MTKPKLLPDKQVLASYYTYDPVSGLLLFNNNRGARKAGDAAGSISNQGYLTVFFKAQLLYVHRICFYLYYGLQPEQIDHKDKNKLNNKLDNLIASTNYWNSQNRSTTKIYPGVRKKRNRYQVEIRVASTRLYLGSFLTIEEAIHAKKQAELKYYGSPDLVGLK